MELKYRILIVLFTSDCPSIKRLKVPMTQRQAPEKKIINSDKISIACQFVITYIHLKFKPNSYELLQNN